MDEQQDRDEARTERALRAPLASLAAAARPTADAVEVVRRGVRRRRRRRAALATAGAGLTVAAVALATTVLPGGAGGSGGPRPDPAERPTTAPALFDCPLEHRVLRDPVPPFPGLADQERVVAEVSGLVRNVWTVRHAEPTALGVVALVQGNLAFAEAQLPEHGVALVRPWASRPDAAAQVDRALERAVLPVAALVRRESGDLPGGAGIALWPEAGGGGGLLARTGSSRGARPGG
ncbi:hypothetical protein [Nocardioides sp. zg-DK7169]|uniref:hypothetical protein n=1 Tax=Nocardioides sp. zg-DK7169 TaxID=2736600 RepID=UPI0015571CF9|nr:hypothetical protein [Nocardioides sp. zg-DK7169]NPC97070.1 hypothetical protein [Nocardioides sp. zg-DK7169]